MRTKLSKAGGRGVDGTLRCPKCGGTNFKAKRSAKGKLLGGFLLAPKSRVKCETCGKQFKRG